MAVLVLLDSAPSEAFSVVVSPLAEMAVGLHVLTERDHHREQHTWASRIEAAGPVDFHSTLMIWSPLWSAYRSRSFYVGVRADSDYIGDLDSELSALAAMPIANFIQQTAWACAGGHSQGSFSDVIRSEDEQAALIQAANSLSTRRAELVERLLRDPESLRAQLHTFLVQCRAVFFDEAWDELRPMLQQEQVRMRRSLSTEGPGYGLLRTGRNVTLQESPLRVTIDKQRHSILQPALTGLALVPSRYGRPHLLVKTEPGHIPVLHYPIYTSDNQSASITQGQMAALADPSRIKMCRLIARQPMSTAALAKSCGMTAPQVSRHLRQLRELGLVRTAREGRYVYYSLDLERVARIGIDFIQAIFA